MDAEAENGVFCPFREETAEEGVLCFDPLLDEYAKPPEDVIERWCERDFRSCPIFTAYQTSLAHRLEEGFL